MYGALDCTKGWAHVGATKKTTWTASAGATPLHVVTGARATLEDVVLEAVDASGAEAGGNAAMACGGGTGGAGGQGGKGGKGGGGKGGPSIGVAFTGWALPRRAPQSRQARGAMGRDGGKGAAGATGEVVSFD